MVAGIGAVAEGYPQVVPIEAPVAPAQPSQGAARGSCRVAVGRVTVVRIAIPVVHPF